MLIPKKAELTIERAANGIPIRYCIDAKTEKAMQQQRLFAMATCPLLIYGAWKLQGPMWLRLSIGGAGLACFIAHYAAYDLVQKTEKKF